MKVIELPIFVKLLDNQFLPSVGTLMVSNSLIMHYQDFYEFYSPTANVALTTHN